MEATVDVSEMMGSEIHLHVSCHGKDVVAGFPPPSWRPISGAA